MSDPRPIGMMDSGVGGLSVFQQVRALMPTETILYVADQGHLPYGMRAREEIRAFSEQIAHYLIHDRQCKILVIACNSASAAALHHLRQRFPQTHIVGMEPAIKPAAERTQTGVIGVITTQATYQGELMASVIDRFAQGVRVETQVCPRLVLLAEEGAPDTPESRQIVAEYLTPLKNAGMDQLVLGCTHFPFLIPQLRAVLGDQIEIVDPAPAVARQTQRILAGMDALNPEGRGEVSYITSGDPLKFERTITRLIADSRPQVRAAGWREGLFYLLPVSDPSTINSTRS